ncbi:SDR family NAD(P)-dependent oxidoreductase [Mesorhizobium sp. Cs1321R2N1]|uniref:SDR family NAD(P)-dependent oxidoreductase n=1 Tax=Mesorhizobium sp. Cs1321R2N1 TaxID=3015174 RepID=UPI00301CD65A
MRFENKDVLVTGGNSGIGRAIVHRFLREGARVAFVGRDPNKGRTVEAEATAMNGQARFFRCNLESEDEVADLIEQIANWGRLRIVVNNAGLGPRRSGAVTADRPGLRWDKLRGPNLDSAYFVSSYALPLLRDSGGGAIVNISSTATLHGNWGLYCVAKAAVEALTKSLAVEGAPHGIRANCVSPGWVSTETDAKRPASGSAGDWKVPPSAFNRMGLPAEIAAVVAFLASDDASFVTGQTLIADGGLTILDYPSLPLLEDGGATLFSGTLED